MKSARKEGRRRRGAVGRPESRSRKRRALELTVQYATRSLLVPSENDFRRWLDAALREDARVTVRIVGLAEGRALNRAYRAKDYATNVLTFTYGAAREPTTRVASESGAASGARKRDAAVRAPVHGDIVLCLPVVEREARAQHKALRYHLAHLVVHGVLHAQGWDHEDADQAGRMEAREVQILQRFGIGDPYR